MSWTNSIAAVLLACSLLACGSSENPDSLSAGAGAHLGKVADTLELFEQVDTASVDARLELLGALVAGEPGSAALEVLDLAADRLDRDGGSELDALEMHVRDLRGQLDALGRLAAGALGREPRSIMQIELSADANGR